MANPWTGPSKLLNTIKYILDNPSVKIKDFTLIDAIGLSKLNKNLPVSKFELKKLITDLKKSAPVLYEKHKALLRNAVKPSEVRKSINNKPLAQITDQKQLDEYSKKYQQDKKFVIDSLSYLHGSSNQDIFLAPIQYVMPLLSILPKSDLCYGFFIAEQLMGMICHKYNLKTMKSIQKRIHLEHGLVTSAMPDTLLSHSHVSKLNKSQNHTLEAFRYYFEKLEQEGIKEKCFTKDQVDSYFSDDKDLTKSRVKLILKR